MWLPLGLAVVALAILNWGLYIQLSSQPVIPRFAFPYYEDFSTMSEMPYEKFGGNWEIRDEMLVQISTSGFDLMTLVPLVIPEDQPFVFETTLRYLGGTMGGGVLFNAQQMTNRQQSHMVRFNVDAGQLWIIYGYFGDDSNFVGQGSIPLSLPAEDSTPRRLAIEVDTETYTIVLDDERLMASIPLQYRGGSIGFISATSQVAFDDVAVDELSQRITDAPPVSVPPAVTAPMTSGEITPFGDERLFFTDTFGDDPGGDSLWLPISGDWRYADESLIQQQRNGFDLSAIYQRAVSYPLRLVVAFQHQQGVGGGLIFNLPAPDSKNGGQMVRYIDEGDVIAWGFFDADGVFNGQGSVAVSSPDDAVQTLQIIADGVRYAIYLNDVEIASNIAINAPNESAYIGLTTSQSVVAFNQVDVFTLEDTETSMTTANIDTEAASGTWIIEGGVVSQLEAAGVDYVAGIGLAGEQFAFSVDITLPDDMPESGAGIVFHMDGRDDQRLGHMVRFGAGGRELFWGRYDAEGVFIGEGGVPLTLDTDASYNLALIVRDADFDIQVNGETVVREVPLQRTSGWVGLISFGGPVTFTDIRLQLGQ